MNSTERRMQIYLMMQNKKNLHIRDLSETFAVDKRTIYRDLAYLRDLDVPITHDPDFGYGIMKDAHIKPLMFTNREIATILMGLSFLKSQRDQVVVDDALKVKNKIQTVIPGELKEFLNAIEEKVVVFPYRNKWPERSEGGNWFTILTAISNNKPVTFSYTSKKGNVSERTIDPILIVYFTDHWNLFGFCHQKKTIRNFILDGMSDVAISDKQSLERKSFALQELLYGRQEKKYLIEIWVKPSSKNELILNLPAEIYAVTEADAHYQIDFHFDDLDYINKWLLSFAEEVIIKKPKELREKRKALLKLLSFSKAF